MSLWAHIRLRLSCEVCELGFPIFLNADHTHSLAKGVEAAKAGFDSIVFDLSALPFEGNAGQTKQAVEAFKAINLSMLVEGEIGVILTGSDIHESSPDLTKGLSTPEARMPLKSVTFKKMKLKSSLSGDQNITCCIG